MEIPETKYAKTVDGVHIAYQTVGDAPVDIAFVMGWTSHIELMWREPTLARFLSRLAAFSRLILFDKRGMGLSDRVPDDRLPSLEVRMDDARAVMDAVGSERAIVMGVSEGGPMATVFAATYPERAIALVLFGTSACWRPTVDYPFPVGTDEEHERYIERVEQTWGTREFAAQEMRDWGAPTLANDDHTIGWFADYLRHAASPGAAIALERMNSGIDVRPALPAIHVPTLVLARDGDLAFTAEETKWMADQIHGARFVSFPGVDHFFWTGNQDELLGEIERFVAEVGDEETDLNRVLATVMFTDIVGSTAKAAELGDRGWGNLVDRHHGAVRALLGRFRGTEVDTAGDGFFATFDGPARAVRCAQAIGGAVREFGLEVRAGVHTGEVERIAGKVGGIAVSVGARIAALAAPSEVLVSQTVRDLVSGSGITFEDAGEHELKGVPDRWHLYRLGRLTGVESRAFPLVTGLIAHAPRQSRLASRRPWHDRRSWGQACRVRRKDTLSAAAGIDPTAIPHVRPDADSHTADAREGDPRPDLCSGSQSSRDGFATLTIADSSLGSGIPLVTTVGRIGGPPAGRPPTPRGPATTRATLPLHPPRQFDLGAVRGGATRG